MLLHNRLKKILLYEVRTCRLKNMNVVIYTVIVDFQISIRRIEKHFIPNHVRLLIVFSSLPYNSLQNIQDI